MKLPLITFEHGRPKVVRAETVQLGGDIKLYLLLSFIPLILDQGIKNIMVWKIINFALLLSTKYFRT